MNMDPFDFPPHSTETPLIGLINDVDICCERGRNELWNELDGVAGAGNGDTKMATLGLS